MHDHAIDPIPMQPKVSVVLLTYQQEQFVRESLESLINQDWPELQIVVSDDASKDKTWALVQQTSQQAGPHVRIVLNQNNVNIGIIGNYNKAVSLCDGDLIFSAAGDDISESDRVRKCVEFWASTGKKADLIATDLSDMSLDGQILGIKTIDDLQLWTWERWMDQRPYHAGASHMTTRRLLAVQPLNSLAKVEDQCLLFRALLMGGAARLPIALVRHRRGGVSNDCVAIETYNVKRSKLVDSATQGIYETDQYQSDAKILAAPDDILKYLMQLRRTHEFILKCFQVSGNTALLRLACEFNEVPFRKRLRFFMFASMRPFYEFVYRIKSGLRGLI